MQAMTEQKVRVALDDRAYDIHVGGGLLPRAGEFIAPLLHRRFAVIVTDETVAVTHLETLKRALALQNIGCEAVILPPGESQKSYAGFERLCEALLALKVERRDHLVALGGGVIGDLVGFAASVLRRGMDFIQIPPACWPRSTARWAARRRSTAVRART